MANYRVGNYVLEITTDKVGGLLFRLMEAQYYLGLDPNNHEQIIARDWFHENMYFPSLNPLAKIRAGVKHWLTRFSDELSTRSTDFIEDFLSHPENLKVSEPEPTPTPTSSNNSLN